MSDKSAKKGLWGKLDICGRIAISLIIPVVGWYLAHIYQVGQQELSRAQIETEILNIVIKGNDFERKLALDFARDIAKKFNDEEFETIILKIANTGGFSEEIRIKAQKNFQKRFLNDPNPIVREIAQKKLLRLSLKETLNLADNFYKVEHFSKASLEYEKATSSVPFGAKVDLKYLEEARKNIDLDPEKSSKQYRKFFEAVHYDAFHALNK